MNIQSSIFIKSSAHWNECPDDNKPEFAFIGRSNVGKSSLINYLIDKKGLSKISNTPGKTKTINHFLINEQWYLVDLPGYGYAKVSKDLREKFSIQITNYIINRKNLISLFLLIDSRHEPLVKDLEFMTWLNENNICFTIIFTKLDKLNKGDSVKNIETYKNKLLETWEETPLFFISSSTKKIGKELIINYINNTFKELNFKFKKT
ncbi:MAG: ribosome biogenesis GTP-binding protein YihA/YsxC [Solirubrobacteraceae bacterium]